jgi:ABC-type nitrate/sulfonate/bicarbonate transport system substrate-binding protein
MPSWLDLVSRKGEGVKRFGSIVEAAVLSSAVLTAIGAQVFADDEKDPGPPAPATIRMGYFSMSLPMLAAQAKGFWTAEALTVQYNQVTSSVQMYKFLRDNLYDIVLSSADNPVNYRLNPRNAAGGIIDARMVFGTDLGLNLTLVARPGNASVESLRGKVIAMDAPDSGFAFVLYKIMRTHGMERGVDYTVVNAGGTPLRLAGLLAGKFDATLLNADSVVRAAKAGFVLLDSVTNVANPYLGGAGTARESWLMANEGVAVRLIRAYYRATRWSVDPANREEAIALLMAQPNTPRILAEQIYALSLGPTGIIQDAKINRQGLLPVLLLRNEFGGFELPQNLQALTTPAGGLYDLSYYRKAVHDLGIGNDPDE